MAQPSVEIHPTAIVEAGAEFDSGVTVGAYAFVGKNVKVGKGTQIQPHSLVSGHTTIGEDNIIFSYAVIGNPPQDLKYKGEPTQLEIGNKNTIREFATLQTGTVQGGGKTVVGSENLFMCYTHVAHDCIVGDKNVIANCVQLAGHVTIEDMTVIGGISAIHQYVRIGTMAMLAGGSLAVQDLPPFSIAEGDRASLRGMNIIAMDRRGVSVEAKNAIKSAYKILFYKGYPTLDLAIAELSHLLVFPEVKMLVDFVQSSKRGVVRPLGKGSTLDDE